MFLMRNDIYELKTRVNENGNTVIDKRKQGNQTVYLARSEEGESKTVSKDWVIKNIRRITNVGISDDGRIYYKEMKYINVFKNTTFIKGMINKIGKDRIRLNDIFLAKGLECHSYDVNKVKFQDKYIVDKEFIQKLEIDLSKFPLVKKAVEKDVDESMALNVLTALNDEELSYCPEYKGVRVHPNYLYGKFDSATLEEFMILVNCMNYQFLRMTVFDW